MQLALVEDDQPVQGFVTESLDHALAIGVGSWAAVGCEGDLGPFAAVHLIELVDELGIPIVDNKLDWSLELVQPQVRLRDCWVTHAELGWAVQLA